VIIPTDAELVECAAATYHATTSPLAADFDGSIQAFLTLRQDGFKVVAIEGTHDAVGWLIDFLAIAAGEEHQTASHPTLGMLHAGFLVSAQAILPKVALATSDGPWAITGHSLGAALALLVGALMAEEGSPPARLVAFAPPRVGGPDFVAAIAGLSSASYRFGNDLVTDVPYTVPPDFDYRQVPLIEIGYPMMPPTRCHAITNYVAAVKGLAA
jgi:hypothetical protein